MMYSQFNISDLPVSLSTFLICHDSNLKSSHYTNVPIPLTPASLCYFDPLHLSVPFRSLSVYPHLYLPTYLPNCLPTYLSILSSLSLSHDFGCFNVAPPSSVTRVTLGESILLQQTLFPR